MKQRELREHNGRVLYNFLVDNIEDGFTKREILAKVDFDIPAMKSPGAVFAGAMRVARRMAEEDGLFIPDAVPGNGFRYVLTDTSGRALSAWVTNRRRSIGMDRRESKHGKFIQDRISQIPPELQPIVEQGFKAHEAVVEAREANEEYILTTNAALSTYLERQREEEKAAEQREESPVV